MGIIPTDMPEGGYPLPEWNAVDEQFNEGCEMMRYEVSYDLPMIPLVWYIDTYGLNAYLHNFICIHNEFFMATYSYWDI